MKFLGAWSANIFIYLLVALLLAALQCSLWLQLFGSFPAPYLWMTILTYWALHRTLKEAVIMGYLISLVVGAMTIAPVSHVLMANMATILAVVALKHRVYWTGSTFYMLSMSVATGTFFVSLGLISLMKDANPLAHIPLLHWLTSILFTTLMGLPLTGLYRFLDRMFDLEGYTGFEGGWI